MKCTWVFQNPLVMVVPVQSITAASGGTETFARDPTAVMMPWLMRTTPSPIGGASGEGCTRPPTSAVTPAPLAAGTAVGEALTASSIAITSQPTRDPRDRRGLTAASLG